MLYEENIKSFVKFMVEFKNLIAINKYFVFLKKEEINALAIKAVYFTEKYITKNHLIE